MWTRSLGCVSALVGSFFWGPPTLKDAHPCTLHARLGIPSWGQTGRNTTNTAFIIDQPSTPDPFVLSWPGHRTSCWTRTPTAQPTVQPTAQPTGLHSTAVTFWGLAVGVTCGPGSLRVHCSNVFIHQVPICFQHTERTISRFAARST